MSCILYSSAKACSAIVTGILVCLDTMWGQCCSSYGRLIHTGLQVLLHKFWMPVTALTPMGARPLTSPRLLLSLSLSLSTSLARIFIFSLHCEPLMHTSPSEASPFFLFPRLYHNTTADMLSYPVLKALSRSSTYVCHVRR